MKSSWFCENLVDFFKTIETDADKILFIWIFLKNICNNHFCEISRAYQQLLYSIKKNTPSSDSQEACNNSLRLGKEQ